MLSNRNHTSYLFLQSQGYTFSSIICFLLKANNTNQYKIAKKLSVSREYINQVITGKRPGLKVKKAISKVLGFNPWE